MKTSRIVINAFALLVILLLPCQIVKAEDMTTIPPVEQPLLREGTLAFGLAKILNVGSPQNEVEAESMLGEIGIAPLNGWIMDYPVTPDIIGELRSSIDEASEARKLPMGRDEALKAFDNLMANSKLAVRPYGDGEKYETPNEPRSDSALDNYYATTGPPIVTYYSPPPDYYYLYAWVPYPFWWGNFRFSGFFILRDFHKVIIFKRRAVVITNHFNHIETHRVFRIDPVTRFHGTSFAGIGARRTRTFIHTGVPGSERRIFNVPREGFERRDGTFERFRGGEMRRR